MIKPSRKLSLIYSGISILMMTVVGVVVYKFSPWWYICSHQHTCHLRCQISIFYFHE